MQCALDEGLRIGYNSMTSPQFMLTELDRNAQHETCDGCPDTD